MLAGDFLESIRFNIGRWPPREIAENVGHISFSHDCTGLAAFRGECTSRESTVRDQTFLPVEGSHRGLINRREKRSRVKIPRTLTLFWNTLFESSSWVSEHALFLHSLLLRCSLMLMMYQVCPVLQPMLLQCPS